MLSPGQDHESKHFEPMMEAVRIPQSKGPPRRRPDKLAGDKAYRCNHILAWLDQHRIEAVIPRTGRELPTSRDARFDRKTYRRRNVIERCVGWLKECRRLFGRFEKTAVHYMAMLHVGFIRRYLRLLT
jgi:transposase